jgi:hypothetical protein
MGPALYFFGGDTNLISNTPSKPFSIRAYSNDKRTLLHNLNQNKPAYLWHQCLQESFISFKALKLVKRQHELILSA